MSMKKSTGLVLLLGVIAVMFVVSCVKQVETKPEAPVNLRISFLAGIVGVELRWDEVAGATGYEITLTKTEASGSRAVLGPYSTAKTYYLVYRDDVGAGSFSWTVKAKNGAGDSGASVESHFTLDPDPEPDPVYGLTLTLVETPDLASSRDGIPEIHIWGATTSIPGAGARVPGSPVNLNYLAGRIVYEEVSDAPRETMSVQLMVERKGSGVAKRWPDSSTEFLLNGDGELLFGVNDLGQNYDPNRLAPGEYLFWARAAWDKNMQSTKKPFNIVASTDLVEVSLDVSNQKTAYPGKVCGIFPEAQIDYDISVSGAALFDELRYTFVIGQLGVDATGNVSKSATFTGRTAYATSVTYATECTKFATVTVDGTLTRVLWEDATKRASETKLGVVGAFEKKHSFVLDLADPTALLSLELPAGFSASAPASLTSATLTFLASDTKCLQPYAEKINFKVGVEKGSGSWSESFAFFTEEVVLGEGSPWDNAVTIDATYTATKTSATNPDEAEAVLGFAIPIMDYATVTATMSVHDCCCEECTIKPGKCDNLNNALRHATEVSTQFIVDNVFFSKLLEDEQVFVPERFLGDADNPLIPASPTQATLTVKLADALWSSAQWGAITWVFHDAQGNVFNSISYAPTIKATELITGECSGYATKTQVTFVGTLTADPAATRTEKALTLVATALDATGNEFVVKLPFLFDTLPPTLTHFTGFRDKVNNHSWVEFKFDQKAESAELAIVVGENTFSYDFNDAVPIAGIPNAFRLPTGITLPYNLAITLKATATDLAGNIGFSSRTCTVSLSEKR
ncbi:MAG TPA: hypothetical protein PLU70_09850 [Thermotogota bacterium]|nr:MAG: hypothetical protein BWX67_01944 [Thermotogota bacterium ADurb.Bin062]HNW47877.1 hypothetical protein [Thermotogota bacterium]HNY82824.1 hypothetical protein [Thermotogota bacterium]HOD91689.1 hypothetical protein [Thermotogota bacterium]HOF24251.1 hypothetical protein [Thermotogota bacterium]